MPETAPAPDPAALRPPAPLRPLTPVRDLAGPDTAPTDPYGLPVLRLVPVPPSEPPYDDEPAVPLRLVPDLAPAAPRRGPRRLRDLPEPAVVRTPPDAVPDARGASVALVHRLLEVMSGVRPVSQLRRDTTPALYAQLERAVQHRRAAAGAGPAGRDVLSVHVQQRPDGVAEVCATVRRGPRAHALALRLEALQGRWVCTLVQGL